MAGEAGGKDPREKLLLPESPAGSLPLVRLEGDQPNLVGEPAKFGVCRAMLQDKVVVSVLLKGLEAIEPGYDPRHTEEQQELLALSWQLCQRQSCEALARWVGPPMPGVPSGPGSKPSSSWRRALPEQHSSRPWAQLPPNRSALLRHQRHTGEGWRN